MIKKFSSEVYSPRKNLALKLFWTYIYHFTQPNIERLNMQVTIIGTGHVGLVTGAMFAEIGHDVLCVDNNIEKIEMLNKGIMPFYEPGMNELVKTNVEKKKLRFSTEISEGVEHGKVIFVAVGTPPLPDGNPNLTYIEKVARTIATNMKEYRLIVEKSTVPVQTGDKVFRTIQRYAPKNISFDVASNPEFLREGQGVYDALNPDRIVIGVHSKRAENLLRELYKGVEAPIIVTNVNSAEIIKHAANSFLAMKISFINSVANICELANANVEEVAKGIGLDKRIGKEFLRAGVGYGGSCLLGDSLVLTKFEGKMAPMPLKKVWRLISKKKKLEVFSFDTKQKKIKCNKILKATKRKYKGNLVHIVTEHNQKIMCTDDHPFVVLRWKKFYYKACKRAQSIRSASFFPNNSWRI